MRCRICAQMYRKYRAVQVPRALQQPARFGRDHSREGTGEGSAFPGEMDWDTPYQISRITRLSDTCVVCCSCDTSVEMARVVTCWHTCVGIYLKGAGCVNSLVFLTSCFLFQIKMFTSLWMRRQESIHYFFVIFLISGLSAPQAAAPCLQRHQELRPQRPAVVSSTRSISLDMLCLLAPSSSLVSGGSNLLYLLFARMRPEFPSPSQVTQRLRD